MVKWSLEQVWEDHNAASGTAILAAIEPVSHILARLDVLVLPKSQLYCSDNYNCALSCV